LEESEVSEESVSEGILGFFGDVISGVEDGVGSVVDVAQSPFDGEN